MKILSNGEIHTLPTQLTFAAIKNLQQNAKTIVVESVIHASIFTLELPWLPERKARTAIPYALEDQLAQPVHELHFAFDKQHYHDNRYLITVINKEKLQSLIQQLDQEQIEFDLITLDWFALNNNQTVIDESMVLINSPAFKGGLLGELAQKYLYQHPEAEILAFQNSQQITDLPTHKHEVQSLVWIAQQLLVNKPLNFCQGEFQHGKNSNWMQKGYQLVGGLCLLWLASLIITNGISLYLLNKKTTRIDQQIAVIYHQFFPDAKQVISPKFRINQLLTTNQGGTQTRFWFLLNEFAKVIKEQPITVEQLRYQNKTLSLTIVSNEFSTLENIEKSLSQAAIKVRQVEASNHKDKVTATLELM